MKVLILGGTGMLGHKLVAVLANRFETWTTIRTSFESVASFGIFEKEHTIEGIDAMTFSSVANALEIVRPDVVVNAVGVVKQKDAAQDIMTTLSVNSIFPQLLAESRKDFGFRLITISTDCVFSGAKGNYVENDPPDALDLYGQSKHWGEVGGDNCLTIRTSIIGRELIAGHSLLEWLISQRGKTIFGYARAIFSGFPTDAFADIIVDIIENHPLLSGIYHVSSEPITKLDLVTKLNMAFGLDATINEDFDFTIDRSLDSTRFRELTGFRPKSWEHMIKSLAADSTPYDKWKIENS
jgi:dTDP-4-dehydrorhamnose reductase